MIQQLITTNSLSLSQDQLSKIDHWLSNQSTNLIYPVYSSFDVRISPFKAAVVDGNLFPAGFNNLCHNMLINASKVFKKYLTKYYSNIKKIGIFTENHSRNVFYFKHLQALKQMIQLAGYKVHLIHPEIEGTIEDLTFSQQFLNDVDLIILNNDLSAGYSSLLNNIQIPVIPCDHLSWSCRRKSHHYSIIENLSSEICHLIGIDPWLTYAYYEMCTDVDLTNPKSIHRLKGKTASLLNRIQYQYNKYGISDTPRVFIKDDSGTYGMGIMTINHPNELDHLSRRILNKMTVGKQHSINNLVLQEAIPSNLTYGDATAEPVVYCIGEHYIGAFLRVNANRGKTANLNSKGMEFFRVCYEPEKHHSHFPTECIGEHIINDISLLSVLIAMLAAAKENSA